MSEFVVAKYGGTSMAQPLIVAEIIESHPEQQVVVVSAPGIDADHPIKMTDQLYDLAKLDWTTREAVGLRNDIISRFDTLYASMESSQLRHLRRIALEQLLGRYGSHDSSEAEIVSIGERLSAMYLASLVGGLAMPPDVFFENDGSFDRSKTLSQTLINYSSNSVRSKTRTFIPGFFGHDKRRRVHLLGRGGSDRTGALYATALDWDYENWTDVDGVYSADPRLVRTAQVIGELTREEVREGAHGGSGILQGDTILDLQNSSVDITVRNTFNPNDPGTRIVADRTHFVDRQIDPHHPIVAVSGRALMELTVRDMGMADQKGYLARLLHRTEELGISIEHLPASQDAATFTFHEAVDSDALGAFKKSVEYHAVSERPDVRISDKGVVYVVGEALRSASVGTRTLGRIGTLLADKQLAFDAVVSHPKSPSLALLVERDAVQPVMTALHTEFIDQPANR